MNLINIRPISKKWFTESTPTNYHVTSAEIGSGDNGTITIYADNLVSTDTVIEINLASEVSADMEAVYSSGKITITLGTGSGGLADDTKNTAILIASAISEIEGFTATFSGTGATAISTETITNVEFTDGTYGTPCGVIGTCLYNSATGTYYVNTLANNTNKNTGWRSFTLITY